MKQLFIIALLVAIVSCRPSQINTENTGKYGAVVMRIERTPCFGTCPVYTATLYSNGILLFEGRNFAIKSGCHYARVSKGDMAKLKTWFKDAGFFNMKDQYPEEDIAPTDLPSFKLLFADGKRKKEILDKNWNTPDPLVALEKKLDTWVSIQNLQSCDK